MQISPKYFKALFQCFYSACILKAIIWNHSILDKCDPESKVGDKVFCEPNYNKMLAFVDIIVSDNLGAPLFSPLNEANFNYASFQLCSSYLETEATSLST
jgi:hypothetical protein